MDIQQNREQLDAQHRKDSMDAREHFYIRPARRVDAAQISRIYNEWVIETSVAKTSEMRDVGSFEDAVEIARSAELPFLVAAARSAQDIREEPRGRLRRNQYHEQQRAQPTRKERIMGFVVAESLAKSRGQIFKGVVEVEFFTDIHRLHRGIGKVLLDRALAFIIPYYQPHPGTNFEFDKTVDGDFYVLGSFASSTVIRKVLIQLLWSAKEEQDMQWRKRLLEEKFHFYHAGFYEGFGVREREYVNVTTMVRNVLRNTKDK